MEYFHYTDKRNDSDHLFQLHVNGRTSGLHQGSSLSSLIFNIYTSEVPPRTSRKFTYVDDMPLWTQNKKFNECQQVLEKDL